jgi:two-component system, NarL family, sensor histidine kinase BarA
MAEEALKPFTQLSKSTERQHRGIGLGLTMVQRNVAALGGKLELSSIVGQGAHFVARIPAKPASFTEKGARSARAQFATPPRAGRYPVRTAEAA